MRVNWHTYFMNIAQQVSTRGTCDRKRVGAVVVRDRAILATGYNGSLPGAPHCDDVGHDMVDNHCVRTVHAEANAIAQAAKHGVPLEGADIYVTVSPCLTCLKLVISAGITRVFYLENYTNIALSDYALKSGVELIQLEA